MDDVATNHDNDTEGSTMTTQTISEFMGLARVVELSDTTTYASTVTDMQHTCSNRAKIVAAGERMGTVMLTLSASGSMHGNAPAGEALGLACATTHMTPDEARAIAHALIIAADEVDAA